MNDQEQLEKLRRESQAKATKELEKEREKLRAEHGVPEGYKCYNCGNNVNYTFILPFLKASGLCPDCWHKQD